MSDNPNPTSGSDATPLAASASASASPAGAPSTGTLPPALPIALKVSFTLNTPDGLRRIGFGLEKDTDGVTVNWTINFVLYERTHPGEPFRDPLVSLNVFVAAALHAKAEAAATQGLTPAQTAHATGPAADAAKAVQAGTMPAAVGDKIIQGTLN
jgi:hypothetical protein